MPKAVFAERTIMKMNSKCSCFLLFNPTSYLIVEVYKIKPHKSSEKVRQIKITESKNQSTIFFCCCITQC